MDFPGKSRSGLDTVVYAKSMDDGTVCFYEEIRTGKKTVKFLTMYKKLKAETDGRLIPSSLTTMIAARRLFPISRNVSAANKIYPIKEVLSILKPLNIEDLSSPGASLLAIIKQYLRCYVFTAFPAEVTAVYDSNGSARVDVEAVNRFKGDDGQEIPGRKILNLMVGIIGGSAWTVSYPVAVGDVGLCVTCKYDLTGFLKTGVTITPKIIV